MGCDCIIAPCFIGFLCVFFRIILRYVKVWTVDYQNERIEYNRGLPG